MGSGRRKVRGCQQGQPSPLGTPARRRPCGFPPTGVCHPPCPSCSMASKPVKPVLGGIPLVVETSGGAFSCASPPQLEQLSGGEAEAAPPHQRRRSTSLWRRSTDDGDMLEMEYARKKLGERGAACWGCVPHARACAVAVPSPPGAAATGIRPDPKPYHAAWLSAPTLPTEGLQH